MAQLHPHPPLSSNSSSFSHGGGKRHHLSTLPPVSSPKKHPRAFNCRCSWQEVAGVLVFSAIPFTAVKAIANSPLGESLQRQLEERKKGALNNASKFKALAEKARNER